MKTTSSTWTAAALTLALSGCAGLTAIPSGIPPAGGLQPVQPGPTGTGTGRPWTGLAANDDPADFHFLLVTDRTGEHRSGVFASAIPKVNLVQPAFVVSVGDLIEGYTEDTAQIGKEWDELEGMIDQLEMPFFYAPGNHDISNPVMAEAWRERFGRSYYAFTYRDVFFLVLNSELFSQVTKPGRSVEGPEAQQRQLDFAQSALAAHADARWTIVVIHQPLWDSPRIHPDWLKVEEMLGERPYTVFAGHTHEYVHESRRGRNYVTLATTGGGSPMRGVPYGEFDHVALIRMTENGPVQANLLLSGILPQEVRTRATRDMMRELEASVHALPLLQPRSTFEGGSASVEVHNPSARDLRVRAEVVDPGDFEIEVSVARTRVLPGQSTKLVFPIETDEPVDLTHFAPARIAWTLTGGTEDGPVSVEGESLLLPDRRWQVEPATREIVTDGSLEEWGELRFRVDAPAEVSGPKRWDGPADASFRFDVRQSDEWIHIGASVTDDSVVASPDRIAREQDGLSLVLDPRPDPERSKNQVLWSAVASGALREMLFRPVPLGPVRADPILGEFLGPAPEDMVTRSRRTDAGYDVEIAVPVRYLEKARGGRWAAFRLNLAVWDVDADAHGHSAMYWRPSRFGRQAIEGSGTFRR